MSTGCYTQGRSRCTPKKANPWPVPTHQAYWDPQLENLNACLWTGEPNVLSHRQAQAPKHLLGDQDTQWYPHIDENPHAALLVGQLNELPLEGVLH